SASLVAPAGSTLAAPRCSSERTVVAAAPGGRLASFRIHVTPPAGSELPAQDLERQVIGGTPSGGNALALSAGFRLPLDVRGAAGVPLAAYVRLTDVASRAMIEGRALVDTS